MSYSVSAPFCLLLSLLLLAGCAGNSQRSSRSSDWEQIGSATASVVPPQPDIAAPVSAAPVPLTTNAGGGTSPVPLNSGPKTSDGLASFAGSTWIPLQRWSKTTGVATLSQWTASGPAAYALRSAQGGVLVLHPNSTIAQWEGAEVRLGFAPQLINEQPYVHTLDLQKTLLPLLNSNGERRFTEPIVIDAGHGGEDSGTMSPEGHREKELTLDWAVRLKRALVAKGFNASLTRNTDVSIALSNRVSLATAEHAGIFISLHFNSSPGGSEAGVETYCLTPVGMPSSLVRGSTDELGQVFPNNGWDVQNLQLAMQIHRALLQVNGHQDRGVRHARFPAVLRGQQCPAVLVEGGYLSNTAEARLIATAEYRQKLADAVARAVEACVGPKTAARAKRSQL